MQQVENLFKLTPTLSFPTSEQIFFEYAQRPDIRTFISSEFDGTEELVQRFLSLHSMVPSIHGQMHSSSPIEVVCWRSEQGLNRGLIYLNGAVFQLGEGDEQEMCLFIEDVFASSRFYPEGMRIGQEMRKEIFASIKEKEDDSTS